MDDTILKKSEIMSRLRTHTRDSYLFINSVVKGATVANAAYTFSMLLANRAWPSFTFWVASLLAMIVTDSGGHLDILLMNFRRTWWDSLLPILVGISEFLLFAILLPETTHTLWRYWYFAFAAFCFSASLLVWHITRNTRIEAYESDAQPVIERYLEARCSDRMASLISSFYWAGVGAVMVFYVYRKWPRADFFYSSIGGIAIIQMLFVIMQKETQRHNLQTEITAS